jgi:hypothetical protein
MSESAAVQSESAQPKQPHPLYPERWSDGTQRPAVNGIARKYPKVETSGPIVEQALRDRQAAILTDRGGPGSLTTLQQTAIARLTHVVLFIASWEDYFKRSDPYTRQGRVRTGYQAYLATLDRWVRLAQLVGMDRREKDISLHDWLNEATDEASDPRTDVTNGGSTDEQEHDDHGDGD